MQRTSRWLITHWMVLLVAAPLAFVSRVVRDFGRPPRAERGTGRTDPEQIQDTLSREVERARRYGRSVALLAFVIERWAAIGAAYGQSAGDGIVRRIGEVLRASCRAYDVVIRLSDDGYLLVVPEIGTGAACSLAHRLARLIAETDFVVPSTPDPVRVNVGIGLACFPDHGDHPRTLLERAVQAARRASTTQGSPVIIAPTARPSMEAPHPGAAEGSPPARQEPAEPVPPAMPLAAVPAVVYPAWLLRVLVIAVTAAAVTITVAITATVLPTSGEVDLVGLGLLLLMVIGAELLILELYAASSFSVSTVPILAAGMLYGVPGIIIVTWFVGVVRGVLRHSKWYRILFNASVFTLGGALATIVFHLFRVRVQPAELAQLIVPGALAGLTFFLQTFVTAVAMAIDSGERPLTVWARSFRWLAPHYLVLGVVALFLALAYVGFGIAGAIAFAMPAVMMRYVIKQYVDRTADNVRSLRRLNLQLENIALELRQRTAQLTLLSELGHLHSVVVEPRALAQQIVERCVGHLGCCCFLALVDRQFALSLGCGSPIGSITTVAVHHEDADRLRATRTLVEGLTGAVEQWVSQTLGEPAPWIESEDLRNHPEALVRQVSEAAGMERALVVSLRARNRIIGVFVCGRSATEPPFSESDRALALEVAERTALTIENGELLNEAARVEALEELNRLKNEFIAIASHELRTPLTTIRGFTELLLMRQIDPPTQRDWLQVVHQDAIHLGELIDDLLDVSRIESGRIQIQPEPVPVRALFQQVIVGHTQRLNGHTLVIQSPDQTSGDADLVAFADRPRLTQILSNLVDNAIKYSPGGGQIALRAEAVSHNARELLIAVSDQGIGISPDHHERIFDRF
ncbi:MAG: diguanylate cyclase, partial [Chloroflexi bacterium]|nr:diguanylate cyclase [Chloroflexota bacterium]